ncbi:transposase [Nocardia testacea]|uniref:Transposase n=1 Tax=Nocardia testacea TaxID=248551 RepID=A0ABW7VQ12_9NOCA
MSFIARLDRFDLLELYSQEFRDDVARVARNRKEDVTFDQVAADFGIQFTPLTKWMRQADLGKSDESGTTRSKPEELREIRRRCRLLEQENEVLRRAAAYLSSSPPPGRRRGHVLDTSP